MHAATAHLGGEYEPSQEGLRSSGVRADVGEDMSDYAGQENETLRVPIREAAHRLGVTEAAIRKRIQRGYLDKELGSDGRVYVYLDLSQGMSHPVSQVDREALLETKDEAIRTLREQLEAERRANEENRRLLAALIQRVPELEAPQEQPGAPEMPGEGPERAESRPATGGPQDGYGRPRDTAEFPVRGSLTRPWWRRVFGG
jgi:hypothetical protein